MVNNNFSQTRYATQNRLIQEAIAGDAQAIQNFLAYLNSTNPDLRRIFQAALHDTRQAELWSRLLYCLGHACWEDVDPNPQQVSPRALQSLAEAFVIDESKAELEIKINVLLPGLASDDPQIQQAAAYVLGLRGDLRALPVLEAMIDGKIGGATVEPEWQMRAIQALAALNDPACGPALLVALANGRGEIHREAARAIVELGHKVEPALHDGLHHPDPHIRWHSARTLGQIGDPRAIDTLVDGLDDPIQEVRWTTARVLANLDATAAPAILDKICNTKMNEPFRQAAYHALHSMPSRSSQEYLQPLLDVLDNPTRAVDAPVIAQRLLADWKNHIPRHKIDREDRKVEIP